MVYFTTKHSPLGKISYLFLDLVKPSFLFIFGLSVIIISCSVVSYHFLFTETCETRTIISESLTKCEPYAGDKFDPRGLDDIGDICPRKHQITSCSTAWENIMSAFGLQ